MKNIRIICFSLAAFLFVQCANKSVQNGLTLVSYYDVSSYQGEKIQLGKVYLNEDLFTPRRIWVNDSLLILNDGGFSEGFLSFYSLNTQRLVTRYGKTGSGPDDFTNPRFVKIKDTLIINAINKSISLYLRDAPLIHEKKSPTLKDASFIGANYLFPICDTMIIKCLSPEGQYVILNNINNSIRTINNYPSVPGENADDFAYNMQIYDAFYSIRPDKEKICVAYKYYPIIDIIQLPDFKVQRIQFENEHKNRYSIAKQGNVEFIDPLLQYTFSYCTSRYHYHLYANASRDDMKKNQYQCEIHVFDWNGNFKKKMVIDRSVFNFAVSDTDDFLYALGLDEELDAQVYKSFFQL